MEFKPLHFIGESVDVYFKTPPELEKKPGCPDGFTWQGEYYSIEELVNEWHDYRRRGRMAENMRPEHATRASRVGSWGVGQDYYRVRTLRGRIFDLYYDRAPGDANHRKGGWYLDKEMILTES